MNKKINKVLSGIAIGALSASACIIPVTGSFAGEINQNGIYGCGANTSGSLGNLFYVSTLFEDSECIWAHCE